MREKEEPGQLRYRAIPEYRLENARRYQLSAREALRR